jgi:hypothetical protein
MTPIDQQLIRFRMAYSWSKSTEPSIVGKARDLTTSSVSASLNPSTWPVA